MNNNKIICPRCNGKGKAKLKDVETVVNCPTCNGTGFLNNDFLNETENKIEKISSTTSLSNESKLLIIQQIIKNPDLFLNGIKFLFKDENKNLFIYLQNQQIFDVENQLDGMLIKLKAEFKNSLAKQCIEFLTSKNRKKKNG